MTYATKSTSITNIATLFKSTLGYCAKLALAGSLALAVLGFGASTASAHDDRAEVEPIVGLWEITVSYGTTVLDNVFTGWTSDGLEFDQDTSSPILTGYICYGSWIKLRIVLTDSPIHSSITVVTRHRASGMAPRGTSTTRNRLERWQDVHR